MRTYVEESGRSPICMILRLGLKRGLLFCASSICVCSFSLMLFAIAVPSILVPAMAVVELENERTELIRKVTGSDHESQGTSIL